LIWALLRAKILRRIQLFLLAASLGGVESLVVLPLLFITDEPRELASAESLGTVRVSVGLEDAEDLIADLKQALPSYSQPAGTAGFCTVSSMIVHRCRPKGHMQKHGG
jgi:hypothetical protein